MDSDPPASEQENPPTLPGVLPRLRYEGFRPNLVAMYLPLYLPHRGVTGGELQELRLLPFRVKSFQLVSATWSEAMWLCAKLQEASRAWGTSFVLDNDLSLSVQWP